VDVELQMLECSAFFEGKFMNRRRFIGCAIAATLAQKGRGQPQVDTASSPTWDGMPPFTPFGQRLSNKAKLRAAFFRRLTPS
jgi:hypothetical protein